MLGMSERGAGRGRGWRITGDAEAKGVGIGGKEAFEDRGFPGAGWSGDDDWSAGLSR